MKIHNHNPLLFLSHYHICVCIDLLSRRLFPVSIRGYDFGCGVYCWSYRCMHVRQGAVKKFARLWFLLSKKGKHNFL